jgi:elongation factor P--(R)-beta-lysine ligase
LNASSSFRPTASIAALTARAALLRDIRQFFADRAVLEVHTPVLDRAGAVDPAIDCVAASANRQPMWLRTSPEFFHKRLLAAGAPDLYELGPVFRDGEQSRKHAVEFYLLEWYRRGLSALELMAEVAALVETVCPGRFSFKTVHYAELFATTLNIDVFAFHPDQALELLPEAVDLAPRLSRDDWLNLLLTHRIEPALPATQATFVYRYPASQAALAQLTAGDPRTAERFELYLGPLELANGYYELADAAEQQARFNNDQAERTRLGKTSPPIDQQLIAALNHGLPPVAGVALGFERLLMVQQGWNEISAAQAFGSAD